MAEVSEPFQPFDPQTSANDMSDFIAELPEWYVDQGVQEVTLLGDPENKDSISLSITSDIVELSPDNPLVAVSTQLEKDRASIITTTTPKSPISSASDASIEVRGIPSTNSALSTSTGPSAPSLHRHHPVMLSLHPLLQSHHLPRSNFAYCHHRLLRLCL